MKQYVIIGNSAAGISAIEGIRKYDLASKITVVSDEDYSGYCRCLISYYLAQDIKEEKILFRPKSFYSENNVELLLNKKVARVDPKKNRVVCEDKTILTYDALLIATGSSPKFTETPGIKKRGVFGFRTIKDAKEIMGLLPITKTACVMGGGLVGLKAAYALKKNKIDVKVIVRSKQVLSQMLDFDAAMFVQKRMEDQGIEIILGQDVSEIIGEGEIRAVKLDSGKAIGCSLVIVGKGVDANAGLAKETEIKTNAGIIADNLLQTNIPDIYTSGDVCESFDIALGRHTINALWPIAVEQGKIAGSNMTGANLNYAGSLGMNSIEFFGLPVVSLGVFKLPANDLSFQELKALDFKNGVYKKLILKNNVLVGAVSVGDIKSSGVFLRLIRERIDISSVQDKLLKDNFGYPNIMDLVKEQEKLYV